MSQGCYYVNDLTGDKAAWIDIRDAIKDEDRNFNEFLFDNVLEDIAGIILNCGYEHCYKGGRKDNYSFKNGLFKLTLEQTHCGTGLILYFDSAHPEFSEWSGEFDPRYILAKSNINRAEIKIWRELIKSGYDLYVATGGYTSKKVVL